LPVDVQEGFDEEVLLVVDKALTYLFESFLALVSALFEEFDVFTCRDLPPLLNSLSSGVASDLVTVSKRIILACLSQKVLGGVTLDQEHLFNLEEFKLHTLGSHDLKVPMCTQQELLVEVGGCRESDVLADGLDALVDLLLEASLLVGDDREVGVADPGVDEPSIEINSLLN